MLAFFACFFVHDPWIKLVHLKLVFSFRAAFRVIAESCSSFALETYFYRSALFGHGLKLLINFEAVLWGIRPKMSSYRRLFPPFLPFLRCFSYSFRSFRCLSCGPRRSGR